jgi:hypothetical protein
MGIPCFHTGPGRVNNHDSAGIGIFPDGNSLLGVGRLSDSDGLRDWVAVLLGVLENLLIFIQLHAKRVRQRGAMAFAYGIVQLPPARARPRSRCTKRSAGHNSR